MKKIFKKLTKRTIIVILALIVLGVPLIYLTILNQKEAKAAWFDENWLYRKAINIATHTAAETNVYINLTGANDVDTSDTARFQSDCGDLRFTKQNGELLPYYIASGCGTADTVVHVNFDSFPAGAQIIYLYYGNPSALNGGKSADFSTEASNYTFTTIGSEEQGTEPVGYWKFDDGQGTNAQDTSPGNNDGAISGAAWTAEDQCVSGKCLSFDGSDDVVTTTQASSVNLTSKTAYTISTWFKAISDGEGDTGQIIQKGTNTYLRVSGQSGTSLNIDASLDLATTDATKSLTAPITTNTWNHIALVYTDDGDDEITIYVNGKDMGSSTNGDGSPTADSNNLLIGGTTTANFQGYIDEVKIYPYARTAAQVKTDYNAGKANAAAKSGTSTAIGAKQSVAFSEGLVGYWKMDETSGTSAADASGNSNTGTLTSAQETGTADDTASSNTTALVGTNNTNLGTTDDMYNNMRIQITGGGGCGITTGTERTISDYTGSSKTITVGTAFSAETDSCTFTIFHQTGGRYGQGVSFDGVNDYINVADAGASDPLRMNGATNLTLSAWVYIQNLAASGEQFIVSKYSYSGLTGYAMLIQSNGSIRFNINGSTNSKITATGLVTAGRWTHLTSVFSNGNTMKVYVDGVEKYSASINATTLSQYTGITAIGGASDNPGSDDLTPLGTLDETRIYNRALSPKEISDLYNFAPGPAGYWDFEGGSESDVVDKSGGGYNGTFAGTGPYRVAGKYGKAGNFVNTNNKVSTTLSINTFRQGTISMWVKEMDLSAGGYPYLASAANACNKGMPIVIDAANSRYLVNSSGQSVYMQTVSNTLVLNKWQYITVTWNASRADFYIDGILQGSDTAVDFSDLSDWNTNVLIGSQNVNCGSLNNPAKHLIDEVKVYNYARTQKQIIEDMNAGHPAVGSPVGSAIAHWKFDEGYGTAANDSTPNDNDLTLSSSSWTDSGKFNKAWNGTGALWASRADDADFDFTATDDFAVSLWYKSDSASNPAAVEYLLNKGPIAASAAGYAVYANTSGNLCFGIDDDTTWNPDIASCTSTDVYDSTWHHVVGVRDTVQDKTYLYVDGVQKDSDTDSTTATLANSSSLYIGDSNGSNGTDEFNGDIDEVKIYRYALTADEVKTEYNRGSSLVLGSLGINSTYAPNAANQEYCIPGDTASCAAPVGRWDFEEKSGTSANDSSGNGNTGTLGGDGAGTDLPLWKPGKIGGALQFDRTDDSVQVSDSTSFDGFVSGGTITVSVWLKLTAIPTSPQTYTIVNKQDQSNNKRQFSLQLNSTNITFQVNNDGTVGGWAFASLATSNITAGVWYHLTGTNDGTNIKVYLNGAQKDSQTGKTSIYDGNAPIGIGAYIGNGSNFVSIFNGFIDQVRIYNYARTPAQIAWDYNRGKPVARWKMDECQGTAINDSSGNSNTGTLTIGPLGEDTVGTCATSSTAWGSGATGKRNASLSFDGTDDAVTVTDTANLRFNASTDDFSLFAWVKRTTTGTEYIISKEDADNDGYRMLFTSSNTVQCSEDATDATSTSTITDTNWHFVGCTIDRDGNGQVYIDGRTDGSAVSMGTDAMATASNITIGTRSYTSTSYLNGQIDDVKIFNYALTATQVKDVYNDGAVRFGPVTGSP